MKKQITSISPVQTAKVFAIFHFLISLPLALFMFIAMSFSPGPRPHMGPMLIFMPVLYALFGFVFTFMGSAASSSYFPMSRIPECFSAAGP